MTRLRNCLAILLVALVTTEALAQRRVQFQSFDPQAFMEQFFGEETEAQRAQIAHVPVSLDEETQGGQQALQMFLQSLKNQGISVVDRGPDVQYLKQLVSELRPLMTHAKRYRTIQVLVVETDDTDARSFPGGTIVVFRGLLDFCESEAALVGILGHELSHIDRGHQLYYLRRMKYAQNAFTGGFNPQQMMELGGMMARMFMRPFRPEEETEADQDGAKWAFELGYDAQEMANVFLRLHKRDQRRGKVAAPSFLRSHPVHADRFQAILADAKRMAAKQPDQQRYVGRENLEQRTPRSKQEFPE